MVDNRAIDRRPESLGEGALEDEVVRRFRGLVVELTGSVINHAFLEQIGLALDAFLDKETPKELQSRWGSAVPFENKLTWRSICIGEKPVD